MSDALLISYVFLLLDFIILLLDCIVVDVIKLLNVAIVSAISLLASSRLVSDPMLQIDRI